MFTIAKQFGFSASHSLPNLQPGHPCRRTHGHNYVVTIELQSTNLNADEFVVDFRDLSPLADFIAKWFEHKHLNDAIGHLGWGIQPTCEALAYHLFRWCHDRWPETSAIRVAESLSSWAEFRPPRTIEEAHRRWEEVQCTK